ncbi:MAG: radical SAM family heme chaperone HemW [Alphaproteobacteria bacterium]|nr:radical SAM family heme chaperone HemW [Alphaproteobacteria bacterium]
MSKCNYCAFYSHACASPDWDKYTNDIIAEIDFWANTLGHISVPTVFFGGGTPSLLPTKNFAQIIERLRARFDIDANAEITLEANPGTLDAAKLTEFIKIGTNRISVGVQSFDDDELKFLGRRHDARTARQFIDAALSQKIRVSADFIYGLPHHNTKTVEKLCRQINDIGISHCSMYELTIEPSTPFGKMNLQMPTNDDMADMYQTIQNTLNLSRYEVSNYATPGNECQHNQNVWDGGAYIGIGPSAAGRIFMNDTWYEQIGNGAKFEKIDNRTRAIEKVITSMRTVRGVLLAKDVQSVLNMEYANEHPELVKITGDRMCTTDNGMIVLDDLLVNLIN